MGQGRDLSALRRCRFLGGEDGWGRAIGEGFYSEAKEFRGFGSERRDMGCSVDTAEECAKWCLVALHCTQCDSGPEPNTPGISKPAGIFKANQKGSLPFFKGSPFLHQQ